MVEYGMNGIEGMMGNEGMGGKKQTPSCQMINLAVCGPCGCVPVRFPMSVML